MSLLLNSDLEEIIIGLKREINKFSGKNILITGARGFLGRYFIDLFSLLNEKYLSSKINIVGIDNFITAGDFGKEIQDETRYKFIKHNIIHPIKLSYSFDFIIHAAGIASPYYYKKWPLDALDVSTVGLRNVLELAEKHTRIIFFSSSEIYGNPNSENIPTKETYNGNVSCLGPRACYDESKRMGETLIQIYNEKYNVNASIIRPFNVYGPGMQKYDYRVLPNFASKIFTGDSLKIYGDGSQTRTFCYVTDAIIGFLKVLIEGKAAEPYNIGNPTPEVSMLDLMKIIEKILPEHKFKFEITDYPESYPADEPMRRCPDISKVQENLDFHPSISLEEGLKRFFKWAKQNY
tara:strand:- start:161 stop:1207 length:1047 start_codon:yes stop_codon:yes gene_type:complete